MKRALQLLVAGIALFLALSVHAKPKEQEFVFSVIGQPSSGDDATLRDALRHSGLVRPAFIVVNGIRPRNESCSDSVFQRRRHLLGEADWPVIIVLTARDWAGCRSESGDSIAQERLSHLRSLLFASDHEARTKRLTLVRQSSAAKYRSYSENASWQASRILFATVNLPSNNNHYLTAAGRNNEFEDRLVANRAWLQRIFSQAKRHKMRGIVLFADANPLAVPARTNRSDRRDGFAETRKQILSLSARFPGKVLLVHGQPSTGGITWRDNLGVAGAGRQSLDVAVYPTGASVFAIRRSRK
ncbi:MAG: hypothetical protein VB032_09765 [Burkholderiaceae bacterium]|nr:hypothetical protein [Burkholderiaceae bacterium]